MQKRLFFENGLYLNNQIPICIEAFQEKLKKNPFILAKNYKNPSKSEKITFLEK